MVESMTTKERMLAAIKMEPIDRLPFWPKLSKSYEIARKYTCKGMSFSEILDWIGCDRQIGIPSCTKEVRNNTSFDTTVKDSKRIDVFTTKFGTCKRELTFDYASQSYHPTKMPIERLEDIKRMTEFYKDCSLQLDEESLSRQREVYKATGDSALVSCAIGISPLMDFIENLAGVENAHYFLYDYPDEVEELFDAMQKYLLRKAEIVAEYSPADVFYMIENTSTTLISPDQYRKYCFRHICQYGEIFKEYDRILALHMCGLIKDILPDLAKVPAMMFEAFTSPPVGNTTLLDGRKVCSDKCLFGGTNAVLWTKTAAEIIEEIEHDLDELPHHRGIMLSSAGVMSPICEPEIIKQVFEFIKEYEIKI